MLIITAETDQTRVFYDPRVEWRMRVCSLKDLNFGSLETLPDSAARVVADIGGLFAKTSGDFTVHPMTPEFDADTVLVLHTSSTGTTKGPYIFGHRLYTRK